MKNVIAFLLFLLITFHSYSQHKWAHVTLDSNAVERTGILSEDGDLLVPVDYDMIIGREGFYFVEKNKKWGCYYNKENIIPVMYDDIACRISEQLVRVNQNGKWGFVDLTNKLMINFKFDFACNFDEGKAYAKMGNKYVYIDKHGEILNTTNENREFCWEDTDTTVSVTSQFKDSVLMIQEKNGKFGVVASGTNKIVLPFLYDEIGTYFRNTILVRIGNKWGAWLDNGKLITEPKYKSIGIFWVD